MSLIAAKRFCTTIVICSTIAITTWCFLKFYIRKKQNEIPTKWKRVGKVEKLIIYPLKTASPKMLQRIECTELGPRDVQSANANKFLFYDRCFLIYQVPNHEVLKLVKNRNAILLSVESIDEDNLVFRGPQVEDFHLKLSQVISHPKRVTVNSYGTGQETLDCGDDAAKWFSKYLTADSQGHITHRLGFFAPDFLKRPDPVTTFRRDEEKALSVYKHWRETDGGIYSWLTSYMVVSSPSIKDVNDRLSAEDQFTYVNLRPNILIEGCEKFAEDDWKWIKIGDTVIMRFFKLCTRCAHITIDPFTGQMNKNLEPLKTIRSYRTMKLVSGTDIQGDKGVLGVNMGLYVPGEIQVGDPIYAIL